MAQGLSAHGVIVRVRPSIADPTGAAGWTAGQTVVVQEVGDIGGLGTTRNEFDISSHNRNIDTYIFGIPRRGAITFPLFYNPAILSHRILRTLQANNDVTTQMANGFEFQAPDGLLLVLSGGVKDMPIDYPVDGPQMAHVSIRATGNYILGGIEYGS